MQGDKSWSQRSFYAVAAAAAVVTVVVVVAVVVSAAILFVVVSLLLLSNSQGVALNCGCSKIFAALTTTSPLSCN